ncbi:hypothetical protein ABPG72_019958 [Tetrahymena utriculariae]
MPRALSPFSRGIVEGHRLKGLSPKESLKLLQASQISRKTQVTKSIRTIQNLYRLSEQNSGDFTPKYHNCGSTSKFSDEQKRDIVTHFENNPNESLRNAENNKTLNYEGMSYRTISNILKENGISSFKQPTSMLINEEQRQRRLAFAHKYKRWTQKWKSCLFSDESIIFRGEVGNQYVWLKERNEMRTEYCKQKEKYPTRVHDLASCHTSQQTSEWLDQQNIQVLDWIPKGADLNPIEKCWSFIKGELTKRFDANDQYTNEELFKAIEQIFYSNELTKSITKMYQKLPQNVQKIIENNGDQINL